jgi:hypothetical protein
VPPTMAVSGFTARDIHSGVEVFPRRAAIGLGMRAAAGVPRDPAES